MTEDRLALIVVGMSLTCLHASHQLTVKGSSLPSLEASPFGAECLCYFPDDAAQDMTTPSCLSLGFFRSDS